MIRIPNIQEIDICIYNNYSIDSIAAAWIVKLKFPKVVLINNNNNMYDLEHYSNKNIIFVGMQPQFTNITNLSLIAKYIIIIDHQKLIYEYSFGNDNIYFLTSKKKAACQIVWDFYFYEKITFCWFVKYMCEKLYNNKIDTKMLENINEETFLNYITEENKYTYEYEMTLNNENNTTRPWFIDYIGNKYLHNYNVLESPRINQLVNNITFDKLNRLLNSSYGWVDYDDENNIIFMSNNYMENYNKLMYDSIEISNDNNLEISNEENLNN